MNTVIIETIVSLLANLAVTLIGVAGAWLLAQISKNQQLNTINTAVGELTVAAEQTVLELQQTGVDGLKEATIPGKTCIVVTPGHIEHIANSIIRLFDDREFARRMGSAGREYVKSTFEYEMCFKNIEEVLLRNLVRKEQKDEG